MNEAYFRSVYVKHLQRHVERTVEYVSCGSWRNPEEVGNALSRLLSIVCRKCRCASCVLLNASIFVQCLSAIINSVTGQVSSLIPGVKTISIKVQAKLELS